MMIMINMIGWLTGYTICIGTLYVLTIKLPNFRQKYMKQRIYIYIYIYIHIMSKRIMHAIMIEVRHKAYA